MLCAVASTTLSTAANRLQAMPETGLPLPVCWVCLALLIVIWLSAMPLGVRNHVRSWGIYLLCAGKHAFTWQNRLAPRIIKNLEAECATKVREMILQCITFSASPSVHHLHVGSFWHFIICCICVFVYLYLCICTFDTWEYHF